MSEDELDAHGDKTMNAAGVPCVNPLISTIALQQQMYHSMLDCQLKLMQSFWPGVLK